MGISPWTENGSIISFLHPFSALYNFYAGRSKLKITDSNELGPMFFFLYYIFFINERYVLTCLVNNDFSS